MVTSSTSAKTAKPRNPLRNIFRLAVGDFVSKALSFLALVYLARVLTVATFGTLEFANSILMYFLLLADGGLEVWGTREAARTADVRKLVGQIVPLRVLLALAGFVLMLSLLPLFPAYPGLHIVLALFGLTLFPQAISLKWLFMGQEQMALVGAGLGLSQLIFAGTVLLFIHNPAGLVWVPLLRLIADSALAAYFAYRFATAHDGLRLRLTLHGARESLKPALTMCASRAMGLLNYNFDSVLLGFLMGASAVGWYTAAYKPVIIALALPMTYFVGLFPALSRSYVNDRDEFRHLVQRSTQLSAIFVVPMVVAGTLLAEPVIQLLYGPDYANSAAPFRILVWSAALVILRSSYAEALRGTGYQKLDLRCAITSASLNVGLNILLIPRYGMLGAATATVTADIVWFVMSYYYFQRDVLAREPLPPIRTPLFAGLLMGAWLWAAQPVAWSTRALIGVVIYFVVLFIAGDPLVRSWLRVRGHPG